MSDITQHPLRVVWFGLLAIGLTLIIGGIWTALLVSNLAISPMVPWSVIVMGALLWLVWRYLDGAGWPKQTASLRQDALRARPVNASVFIWALIAGSLGIVALAGLWVILFQLAHISTARILPDYSHYPVFTVGAVLVMASLVGALAEEAGFRGYFQGTLERLMPAPVAILLVVVVMAPEHALTQGFVWPTLLFYACVDVMLGVTAYLTQSIVPGMVVHSLGLFVFFTLVWPGDTLRQIAGSSNADLWFWLHTGQVISFAALSFLAFAQLARYAHAIQPHSSP